MKRNYLRVRGEYSAVLRSETGSRELPPRARRIRGVCGSRARPPGTTSACAENTCVLSGSGRKARNYLRVRGEYTNLLVSTTHPLELPPRARRIPAGVAMAGGEPGNYLRVRGEYACRVVRFILFLELPPRARRILMDERQQRGH